MTTPANQTPGGFQAGNKTKIATGAGTAAKNVANVKGRNANDIRNASNVTNPKPFSRLKVNKSPLTVGGPGATNSNGSKIGSNILA